MSQILNDEKLFLLKQKSSEARRLIIETVYLANAGHIGGPMSATDLLVSLYFNEMNISPENPEGENRDRFVLSKGHSAIALYSVLALKGYFPVEELKTFDSINSRLQAHPDMKALPGLDMSTGSLGQGISAAVGMALGARLQNKDFRTYCILGDGESQEGQVWEAADMAVKYSLDNLVVILDYNKLQQFGWAGENGKRQTPIVEPEKRWEAFGWHVISIDGHNYQEISEAFAKARSTTGKPTVIIANTVKGKGVSFMENEYSWHSRVPTDEEFNSAIQELKEEAGV
ncbi:transketolase [Schinkia azotoformans]|uniref:Transketolase n=1 Tax=Schinkia azotoformans LMG 9581 TaxID=1131731 RepID=K6DR31_SCHAZ|nr:transketolase [Schinkia azotoformans]EKN63251.1 transketolase [Schinkia azotoformans LMG 9581]MEC1637199.1 transketolase [Schinkia azotoformans]MEC1720647.1 transketolase [Schinkia azotoformans]MEC1943603.1 transketolase [Schinkia azotoformans]MED4411786.1 transketolase [Schinkia azotoformans]